MRLYQSLCRGIKILLLRRLLLGPWRHPQALPGLSWASPCCLQPRSPCQLPWGHQSLPQQHRSRAGLQHPTGLPCPAMPSSGPVAHPGPSSSPCPRRCLMCGAGAAPSCPAPGWGRGMGLGCQALPCCLGGGSLWRHTGSCWHLQCPGSGLNTWSASQWANWEEVGSKLKYWKSTDYTNESLGCSLSKFWPKAASPVLNIAWVLAIPSRWFACFHPLLKWESA